MIRVYYNGTGVSHSRDHDGHDWEIDEGYLTVINKHNDQIAAYAPGEWSAVVDLNPPGGGE